MINIIFTIFSFKYCYDNMQSEHIFAYIAQFIPISDLETLNILGGTCKVAKKVCDTILIPYVSDLIYVEHSSDDKWNLYQISDLQKSNKIDISKPWPNMNLIRGLVCRYGFERPCGFIMKRSDIIRSKYYDSECSCYECMIARS